MRLFYFLEISGDGRFSDKIEHVAKEASFFHESIKFRVTKHNWYGRQALPREISRRGGTGGKFFADPLPESKPDSKLETSKLSGFAFLMKTTELEENIFILS